MLQKSKFHWFSPTVFVLRCQQFLCELNCKLYHHRISKDDNVDDSGDKFRTTGANGECHFRLYKSRGQHLLTSARVLDSIVNKSKIKATDTVLEIGPGTGNLTLRLLEASSKVVAIEVDSRMAEALQQRVAESGFEDRLTLIQEDALKTEFPHFDLKEFACRLLANPGDSEFNRLAVNVKLVAEVKHIMDVSKRDFFPIPKVDSSVVLIKPKAEIANVDLNEWCAFTRTCFSKKNKTLGATFRQKKKVAELMRISCLMCVNKESHMLHPSTDMNDEYEDAEVVEGSNDMGDSSPPSLEIGVSLFKEKVIRILKSSGFEDKRPSKLSIEELLHLLSLFNENNIYFRDKEDDASNTELV